MKESLKAIIQDPTNRGYSNGNQLVLGNHSGEITYNVSLGINEFLKYRMIGMLKFSTLEDAIEYVTELGATIGTIKNKEYYSIVKQEGCAFTTFNFYSIK